MKTLELHYPMIQFLVMYIMVIELSGVQFGLNSYARFQNQTSAQLEFDLKSHASMISDQNCTPLSSIATLLHPF